MADRVNGTVIRIDRDKHYAIATDNFGVTYMIIPKNFAQFSSIRFEDLELNDIVSFIGIDGPKGKRAIEIRG